MSEEIKRAGLLLRIIAKILDFIIIAAIIEVIPKAGFLAGLVYLLISDGFFEGRSIGKKLIGLQVVSGVTYTPCTFRESILRNSTLGIGFLFYKLAWIGWLIIFLVSALEFIILIGSSNSTRIGDELAKTIVIDSSQTKQEE